jgi:hypothetical protein
MRRIASLYLLVAFVCGCQEVEQPEAPTVIVNDIVHEIVYYEEDTTPDIVLLTETVYETIYITEEDTTPDVVMEFYSDAADLPMLAWDVGAGDTPMAKKIRDLTEKTAGVGWDDAFGMSEAGGASSKFAEFRFFPLPAMRQGLELSNNGGNPDTHVDIAAGVAAADDASYNLVLSALTKRIDVTWAVGTNSGGMESGTSVSASTVYAVWEIARIDTHVVDVLFSASFTSPTMPASYTKKRLIGAVATDSSSDIRTFTQTGDEFRYDDPIVDVNDNTLASQVYETGTLLVPPNSRAHIYGALSNLTTTDLFGNLHIRPTGTSDSALSTNEAWAHISTSGTFDRVTARGDVMVDSSSQMEYASNFASGTPTITISTVGFRMLSLSNP